MSDAVKSATGQAPGSSSQPRPTTAAAASKPAGDPRDAELESLRRILAEKDQDLANAGQKIKELEENSVTPAELADVRGQLKDLREQLRPVAAAPEKAPVGWEGALKAEGFVDRPEAATAGVENPLPEGYLYRLTTIARYPNDHPRAGELSYNGVTCVHIGKLGPRPESPGEAEFQRCIKFDNGIGITDDREVAWSMAREYGYGLEIETRPVIKYEAVDQDFKPILKPRVGPTGMKLSEQERLVAAR